ncbi:MAG: hemerythrin domain-containing protein [Anaerolineae bacterium]|nr:hemerythrin domain-containing protein [Anaerolineae bacterium]
MRPIETLMDEHRIILTVLDAAAREVQRIQETEEVRVERLEQMVDFFRNFADRCHHAKEEKLLFVRMEERGMPREAGPIGVMLYEHDLGRGYVRAVAEALPRAASDLAAREAVRRNLAQYVQLLRDHIYKEDYILYPMADGLLLPEDQQALGEGFEQVEREEMGEGVHERYHELAHRLGKE